MNNSGFADDGSIGEGALLDGEWPDRLRRGVHNALQFCLLEGDRWLDRELDVHHIVAAGLDGASPGRRLLARWSIGVHSVVNAAIVPRSFHRGQGLHRQMFLHTVNMRLSSAALFAEAVMPHGGFEAGRLIMKQTIQKIGIELVARSGDGVAMRLQEALQSLAARTAGGGAGGKRGDGGSRTSSRSVRQRSAVVGGARLSGAAVGHPGRSCLQHAAASP